MSHEKIRELVKGYDSVALLLQGGGALGSYQCGIYEGIHNAGIRINSISGVSIGAINSALIAGNPPDKRIKALRGFWETITHRNYSPEYINAFKLALNNMNTFGKIDSLSHMMPWIFENQFFRQQLRMLESGFEAYMTSLEGQRGFFKPRFFIPSDTTPNYLSYYSTDKLEETLKEYVDLKRLNDPEHMIVSVGAVNVRTGNYTFFSNQNTELTYAHFMASGALPPGFPAVEIDGEYYWDGGLVSNTPLNDMMVVDDKLNQLIFQVDLWDSRGQLPDTILEIDERVKDIQYSSKTRMVTSMMKQKHEYTKLIKELLAHIPKDRQNAACLKKAEDMASVGFKNVIQLVYRKKPYERGHKDYEFSEETMREHWTSGLEDLEASLRNEEWFAINPDEIFVTHDIHYKKKQAYMQVAIGN